MYQVSLTNQVVVVVKQNKITFRKEYKTRYNALRAYMRLAYNYDANHTLSNKSCIIN